MSGRKSSRPVDNLLYGELQDKIHAIPVGYMEVMYQGKKYGLSRMDFNKGKSLKIYAEELGGNDFISLNYYQTSSQVHLKPCEMPMDKVIHFIINLQLPDGSG